MLTMLITVLILFALCCMVAAVFYFVIAYAMGWRRHTCTGCKQKLVFNKSKPLTQCPHCHTYIRNNNDSNS
jgi:predicted membrane protein